MTKKFVVAFQASSEDLDMQELSGADWREATLKHAGCPWNTLETPDEEDETGDELVMPDDLDQAIEDAMSNFDTVFQVLELKP